MSTYRSAITASVAYAANMKSNTSLYPGYGFQPRWFPTWCSSKPVTGSTCSDRNSGTRCTATHFIAISVTKSTLQDVVVLPIKKCVQTTELYLIWYSEVSFKARSTCRAVRREVPAENWCRNAVACPFDVVIWTGRPVGVGIQWCDGGVEES